MPRAVAPAVAPALKGLPFAAVRTTDFKVKTMAYLVPVKRIELLTFGLQNRCSTAELNRHSIVIIG
jgi:hypothetical protein